MLAYRYAAATALSPAESRRDIEELVVKHGAKSFGYAVRADRAAVTFYLLNRQIRVEFDLPTLEDQVVRRTPSGLPRPESLQPAQCEKLTRQRWRALLLVIRAKIESIEAGIATVDSAFFSDVVLSNGERIEEWALPRLTKPTGQSPPLLLGEAR